MHLHLLSLTLRCGFGVFFKISFIFSERVREEESKINRVSCLLDDAQPTEPHQPGTEFCFDKSSGDAHGESLRREF